jgi:hypothetical protein
MERTQRLRPLSIGFAPRTGNMTVPILIATALVAMVLLDVALVMKPEMARSAASLWSELTSARDGHELIVAFLRAGLAVGGTGVGILVLAAFIRGVQSFPYVWLSPVLVGFSSVVLAKTPVAPPLPLSAAGFAAVAGVLLLGGGSLLQLRGVATKIAGAVMIAAPVLLLVAGHAQHSHDLASTFANLTSGARLFLFVVSMTAFGVAFVALASQSPSFAIRHEHERQRDTQRRKLAEVIQRLRESELGLEHAMARAEHAEHSLRVQGAELEAALASQEELEGFRASSRPRYARWLLPLLAASVALGPLGFVYYRMYRPLAVRAAADHAALANAEAANRSALAEQRTRFEAERSALQLALSAQQTKASEAATALTKQSAELSACQTQVSSAAAAPATAPATAAVAATKRAAVATTHSKRVARIAAKPTRTAAKPKAIATQKVEKVEKADSTIGVRPSDDPLSGL